MLIRFKNVENMGQRPYFVLLKELYNNKKEDLTSVRFELGPF